MNQSASEQLQTDIPASISAMVLLNSACQALLKLILIKAMQNIGMLR